jgi:glycosyltransferase involved in cell wall biosynthesis
MGGAERIVVALAAGAERAGHLVGVASGPGELSRNLERWFPLPVVARHPARMPEAAIALERARRSLGADLIHFHNPTMAVLGGLVTARGHRLSSVVTVHGVPEEDYTASARLLRLAGLPVVACGPAIADALGAKGVSIRATIVNGVGPPPPAADRARVCAEWGLPAERPLVLCVGRLVPQKNHAAAIRAIARVPEAALVVAGDGPLLSDLQRQARSEDLSGRVLFAGVRPDARALIGGADAVLFPSRWEGLPLAALETLAAGTPLVATSVRGLRELLTDEVDSLLVPPDSPDAMAAALRRALFDPDLRARLRRGSLETARRYSEQAMVDAYLGLYEELLRRG